jgi:hypothetical protein
MNEKTNDYLIMILRGYSFKVSHYPESEVPFVVDMIMSPNWGTAGKTFKDLISRMEDLINRVEAKD